jgi:hypothetical protein
LLVACVALVEVYPDVDGNGQVGAGEALLGGAAPDLGSVAAIDFGSAAPSLSAGSATNLLVSYRIAGTLSRTFGQAGLALLLAPLGLGLALRLRRRWLALLMLLTACPATPQPRSFSSSLTAVDASAATPGGNMST